MVVLLVRDAPEPEPSPAECVPAEPRSRQAVGNGIAPEFGTFPAAARLRLTAI